MNRLDELIDRFLDNGLTSEERIELKRAIDVDPNGADQLLACYQQNRILSALFRPSSADAVNAILAAVTAEDSFVDSVMREARADAIENTLVHDTERKPRAPAATADSVEQPAATPSMYWFYRLSPRLLWASAIAAVMFIGLFVWLFLPASGEPTLAVASGTRVTLERDGQSFPAQDGLKLLPGDLLRISGSNGAAIGYGTENTRVAINDDTELKTLAWRKGKRFELRRGKLKAVVARQRPWKPMVIVTAQAEARVLGTKFTLTAGTNFTRLEVTEGKVKLTRSSDNESVKVSAGQFTVAATNYLLAVHPLPGKVLRDFWLDLPGGTLQDLTYHARYPKAPSGHDFPPSFETNTNWPSAFGTRMRAYLLPPVSGDYEFRVSAIGQIKLWLSPDDDPANRVIVGQIIFTWNRPGGEGPEATASRQDSGQIPLEAGRRYDIEAIHKYGTGEDRLSVTWKRPNGTEEPIPAEFLSPFIPQKNGAK